MILRWAAGGKLYKIIVESLSRASLKSNVHRIKLIGDVHAPNAGSICSKAELKGLLIRNAMDRLPNQESSSSIDRIKPLRIQDQMVDKATRTRSMSM